MARLVKLKDKTLTKPAYEEDDFNKILLEAIKEELAYFDDPVPHIVVSQKKLSNKYLVYEAEWNYVKMNRDGEKGYTHEFAKKKANKILSNYDGSFSSLDVKRFIDEIALKNEKKEFQTTISRHVASASTLQAIGEYRKSRIAIENMRNEDVREAREDHTVTTTKRFLDEKERTTKRTRICKLSLSGEKSNDEFEDDESGVMSPFPQLEDLLSPPQKHIDEANISITSEEIDGDRNIYNDPRDVSPPLISIMREYCKKDSTSKFDLSAFESERNPLIQHDCHEREWLGGYLVPIFQGALVLDGRFQVPWGEVTVQSSLRRRNRNKKILEEKLDRGHLADLLCHTDFYEVLCLLACGGPHKVDLTKLASDEFQLPRIMKDSLDDMREKFNNTKKKQPYLFTIGIQGLVNDLFDKLVDNEEIEKEGSVGVTGLETTGVSVEGVTGLD
ncbi:hypothetical protein C1645_738560 [Glomus cerebriforme]|uniref:Uncharacterized protein n=1 Tax=Glomus cerebriforme TaxID=658196 RepID=A0A397SX11_9GLOM|nr:hypothetical protein C1645_738560 [Glomus cerebriforme]